MFNEEVHDDYLRRARNGENPGIPSIAIEIFFSDDCSPEINKTRGLENSETCDSAGLSYEIAIKRELLSEFLAVIKDEETDLIPTEYFKCTWTMFSGTEIYRRPEGISCNRLEADGVGSDRRSSQRNRTMLESLISDSDLRAVSAKQRQMRREIDKEVLKKTTGQVSSGEHLANVGFQMDHSPRSDWRNSITLGLNNRPIQFEGHGMQILVKSHLALDSAMGQNVLLLEEPESHLSHTSLMQLLSSICERLGDRQAFITTHSTFVLNRLGIDKLSLIAPKSKPIRLSDLSIDTVRYFQKQSGYDTLRICLATKLVLVEGPTDEMITVIDDIPQATGDDTTIKVGASPTPHAEILNAAKDLLAAKGWTLEVVEFTDYVQPNVALSDGSLDANYFQHQPYLDNYNEENGTDLVGVAKIHFEAMALYGGKAASLDDLKN